MSEHLNAAMVEQYADGELRADEVAAAEEHLRACAACASAVVAQLQLKRAVREAAWTLPPDALRRRITRRRVSPLAVAAVFLAFSLGLGIASLLRTSSGRELADLHATILASAHPVDVISTDRHTVKPWFEGRLPFSFAIPELGATPFRLAGGRVVYVREQPVAYLLVTKGAHKISLFAGRDVAAPRVDGFESVSWRAHGLHFVAIGDVSRDDLTALRNAFVTAR
jgi:anti-sigma factor RsiW